MFRLCEIKDIVRLKPKRFASDRVEALTLEINKKYANKVLYKVRGQPVM
jgi:DNA-directed RNA polymerase III subunit RPC8